MSAPKPRDFAQLYGEFQSPIAALDCGAKCSPYNEHGVPFCCDTRHAVPAAYEAEWEYLQASTDLWHAWESADPEITAGLQAQTPSGIVLIECLGARLCQRGFRAISCRSFPFFPYLTRAGEFIGLSYYWEYEDRCWVISNLQVVTPSYRQEFVAAYDCLFEQLPDEKETFRQYSIRMRRAFGRRGRPIPLLHRDGQFYHLDTRGGGLERIQPDHLPRFGPYEVAAAMPFPDEI
jgi:hypothetical protein